MKIKYFQHKIEINKYSMTKTWQTLNKAIGKQRDKSCFPQSFKINNEDVSDRTQTAESFNKYFSSIGKLTSENV